MKKSGKFLAAFLILCLVFLLTGCWNYHEIETLQVVAGIAVDPGQHGYKYHLTFECVKLSSAGQPGKSGPQPVLLEADGNSIFDAVRNTLSESDKKLYFSQCKIVIISREIAKSGLKGLTDWFLRDAEPRTTLEFLVSKEPTAGEILRQKPKTADLLSFQISNTLHESAGAAGKDLPVPLYQMVNVLNTDGVSLTLPAIQIKKEAETPSDESGAGGSSSGKNTTVQVSGDAVFKDDKMIGFLSGDQMKYVNFVLNKIGSALIVVGETPASQDISLEILSSSTRLEPVMRDGIPSMDIKIRTNAAFAEQDGTRDVLKNGGIKKMESISESAIRGRVESVIASVQQDYGSDIFGFGSKFAGDRPGDWQKLKPDWAFWFRRLKCNVSVTVTITNTATAINREGEPS